MKHCLQSAIDVRLKTHLASLSYLRLNPLWAYKHARSKQGTDRYAANVIITYKLARDIYSVHRIYTLSCSFLAVPNERLSYQAYQYYQVEAVHSIECITHSIVFLHF